MTPTKSFKSSAIKGEIEIPGDKSISHRALILSSQAIGTTKISGLLEGEDVLNTAEALKKLGVFIEKEDGKWVVKGVGVGGLSKSESALDMGNAGTAARLMMGLVSPYEFSTEFTGDESLQKRPMNRVLVPLKDMGIDVEFLSADGCFPLIIKGSVDLMPIEYEMPVASAQVKSAILLAGLNTPGTTSVIENAPTRDHTELMLEFLGAELVREGNKITLTGEPELQARDIVVPSDPSSAAFFIVAAIITPESEVLVKNVCVNPLRTGLFTTLKEMGADIEFVNERQEAGELITDIKASHSKLKGTKVPAQRAPSMIDEYPILAIAASFASGVTRMEGLEELKVKESNRLEAIINGLQENGVGYKSGDDWLEVSGSKNVPGGGFVATHMDHRIAMSFLVLGAAADEHVTVDDTAMIGTSFPNFIDLFQQVGGKIE